MNISAVILADVVWTKVDASQTVYVDKVQPSIYTLIIDQREGPVYNREELISAERSIYVLGGNASYAIKCCSY
jgi:hypothetical protein